MNLELNDLHTKVLVPRAIADHPERPLPPQSPYCDTEGDPRETPAGARTRAPTTQAALRAAEQGTVCETAVGLDRDDLRPISEGHLDE
jgi:hypothetical protein